MGKTFRKFVDQERQRSKKPKYFPESAIDKHPKKIYNVVSEEDLDADDEAVLYDDHTQPIQRK